VDEPGEEPAEGGSEKFRGLSRDHRFSQGGHYLSGEEFTLIFALQLTEGIDNGAPLLAELARSGTLSGTSLSQRAKEIQERLLICARQLIKSADHTIRLRSWRAMLLDCL
jgi:hypothetical protein